MINIIIMRGKNTEIESLTGCAILVYRYQNRGQIMLAIRLPAEVETRLEALAKATGRTKTFYAREAILEHLDDLEDLYLAEQRLIDIRAGRSRTHTLEEVERDLGLAD
jgi:RHH-type rel operon transcriptional repressor/antitoxin RelB